jgi:hypothetical protein
MLKQLSILMIAFILSVTVLLLLNDNIEEDQLLEQTLYTTTSLDVDSDLVIHSEYNEDSSYNMNDEKLNDYSKSRIRIVESSELTNTIKIYSNNIYDDITSESVVLIENNVITITSDLGPTVMYTSPTFLTYAQFNYDFFESIPHSFFVIYVPEGTSYILD